MDPVERDISLQKGVESRNQDDHGGYGESHRQPGKDEGEREDRQRCVKQRGERRGQGAADDGAEHPLQRPVAGEPGVRLQDDDGGFYFLVYPRDREYEYTSALKLMSVAADA